MSTSRIVFLSMLSAMSFVLMWLSIPVFPPAPYLKYDPSDLPLLLATIIYGPFAGLMTLAVKNTMYFLLHGGNIFSILMNFSASATFLLVTSFFYKRINLIVSGSAGAVAMALIMVPMNMVIVPLIHGVPFEKVWALMLPIYIPFNLIKGCLNVTLFLLTWKVIQKRSVMQKMPSANG